MTEPTRLNMPLGLIIREGFNIDDFIDVAERAEAARIQLLFTAGGYSTDPQNPQGTIETLTMLCAIAARTKHTGLVGTLSSTFEDPFNLARRILSLDHISKGRAGLNVVTSLGGAENFGSAPLPSHSERYERAEEFTQVLEKLWDSWEADAPLPWTGGFISGDPQRVHTIDHEGKYYKVRGPLDVGRSPQGRPILFQAGSSEEGLDFGVRHADAIFTTGLETIEDQRLVYKDIKDRAASAGRNPDEVLVFPGVAPFVAPTQSEASALYESARSAVDLTKAAARIAPQFANIDLSAYDADAPLPGDAFPDVQEAQGMRSRYEALRNYLLAKPERTVRDLLEYHSVAGGHWQVVGTPESVADELQERYETGAADGFVIINFYNRIPGALENILKGLIPELQRRGIFHSDYEGGSLRESLGLPALT